MTNPANTLAFSELPLNPVLQKAIAAMGFTHASPIQAQAIPPLLEGHDVIGQAQTGTGKTAAFAIPVIQTVDARNRAIQSLVLCPTRELALQVTESFNQLGKGQKGLVCMAVYGGQPIPVQMRALRRQPQIVVGTPGRVMDLMRRGALNLSHVQQVVLDEADEMLNRGFRRDIETILRETPAKRRQTILFSATMPKAILDLTAQFQNNAVHIKVAQHNQPVALVEQKYLELTRKAKSEALVQLIEQYQFQRSLVFCNTKWQVDALVKTMQQSGFMAEGLHGGMPQPKRDRIMRAYRSGHTTLLIATDVAARGLDVNNIEAVFNYDLPLDVEFYIHRIGRTGRAGKAGSAFTFVERSDYSQLKKIRNSPNVNLLRHELTPLKAG
ncbi:MAG: DEAD/DEAH box helicase [Vampirovibrionales bacterium]|nr:DEAD/DEAH box helicase [Vampirovibrionales bacterium]